MKIRNQISMAIVPLFLGTTLVTGALTYFLQMRELTWGLSEEATSIAVATARLADEETVKRLADGRDLADNPIREQFQSIIRWGRARRLTLLSGVNHRILWDETDGVAPAAAVTLPESVAAVLEREPYALGTPRKEPGGGSSFRAFAPVRDATGALLGIIAIETRADTLTAQRAAILQSALVSLGAATLLGLLLSILISSMITRRLSRLTHAVSRLEASGDAPEIGSGVVHEINDLSNTFETLKSVLGEVLSRTRRTLVESEQFRTDEDLAETFRSVCQQPAFRAIAGLDVVGSVVGGFQPDSAFGIWETPSGGCAFIATISEQGALEQSLVAAAAIAYLEQASGRGDLAPALESMADLFPLLRCDGAAWRDAELELVRWSFDRCEGRWNRGSLQLHAGDTMILHTMGAPVDRRLRSYVELFQDSEPGTLLLELPSVLEGQRAGVVLLLKRPAAGAAIS